MSLRPGSPANQDDVFRRIGEINEAGISIVMVEQNARTCLEICDRAYVLDQGRNAYTGTGRSSSTTPRSSSSTWDARPRA